MLFKQKHAVSFMKILYLLLLCLLLFPASRSCGQVQSNIIAIKARLSSSKGEQRVMLLNDLAWEYRFASPDTSILLAKQAFDLGEKMQIKNQLARALNILGVANNYKGDKIAAYEYYTKALAVSTEQNDSIEIAYTHNNLGRVFHEKGLLDKAYPYIAKAVEIFKKINDSTGLAYCYQSLGYLHQTQRNFSHAEENYKKALALRIRLRNQRNIHIGFYLLGRLYTEQGKMDPALYYLLKADSVGRKQEDQIQLAETWISLAKNFLFRKNISKADSILNISLHIIQQYHNVRILSNALLTGAEIAIARDDISRAAILTEKALVNSKKIGDVATTKEAHFQLWKLYERQKNSMAALYNQNQYLLLRDTMRNLDIARQEDELKFERQMLTRETENLRLKNENDIMEHRQRLQALMFLAVIVGIFIASAIMWLYLRKLRKITTQLAKKNEMLTLLNQEKDALMSVVAHDLKSPLNKVQGLTNLLEREAELSPNQKYYLQIINRVLFDGLVFIADLLSVHAFEEERLPEISEFDASEIVQRKTDESDTVARSKNIKLRRSLQSITIRSDKEYLSRITDNLISNAIKFSPAHSEVTISLQKKAGKAVLTVEDKGPGFSEQDRKFLFKKFKKLSARPTAGESSNGLGLAIVKTLVDGLGGSIEVDSVVGEGARIIVRLPLAA
jgi:signal transduction histidine kinase